MHTCLQALGPLTGKLRTQRSPSINIEYPATSEQKVPASKPSHGLRNEKLHV